MVCGWRGPKQPGHDATPQLSRARSTTELVAQCAGPPVKYRWLVLPGPATSEARETPLSTIERLRKCYGIYINNDGFDV